MTRRALVHSVIMATALAMSACGSEGSGSGGSAGSAATSSGGAAGSATTTTDPTPPESCVKPGDKGNDKGVGEYCTPTGNECDAFPAAGLCLAKVGEKQWFCTRIGCDATTDCGMDAGCIITDTGSACVPCRCDASGLGCPGATGSGGSGGSGGTGGTGGSTGGTGGMMSGSGGSM